MVLFVSIEMIDQGKQSCWKKEEADFSKLLHKQYLESSSTKSINNNSYLVPAVGFLMPWLLAIEGRREGRQCVLLSKTGEVGLLSFLFLFLFFFFSLLNMAKFQEKNLLPNLYSHILPLLTSNDYNCPCICLCLLTGWC